MPEVLGNRHSFCFENSRVFVAIPCIDEVGRGHGHDEVASIGAKCAVDNQPLEFHTYKVDVEVPIPITVSIPLQVLNQPANAYSLLSDKEQQQLSKAAEQHRAIAERAFSYWMRIVRWVCDNSRIGRDQVEGFRSGWSTYLFDVESDAKIWIQTQMLHLSGYRALTLDEWHEIQLRLSDGSLPPLYVELKHDAEENARLGNYRQALVDLAIACETFLRFAVLQRLPEELSSKLKTYIEKASINQYINGFFPEILDDTANQRFKKLKPELDSLFNRRNKLLHMGQNDGIDEGICLMFLQVTQELFSLTIP